VARPDEGAGAVARARELVLAHGWNATAYQVVNPGIALWFAPEGDAVVGYVRHARTRVVAGAPVCAAERLTAVAESFERDAARAGDLVCYFGAEARLEARCRVEGFAWLTLGAQPVWDPARWPSIVAAHASLRAQLHRAINKGVAVDWWPVEAATANPVLHRVLREWLATRGLPPLHFLVEPETLERLHDRRVFVARRGSDVVAFLVASPVPRRQGWLIEQFVRGHAAPNGTVELMVDAAMRRFGGEGARYVTLGLAPLSRRAGIPSEPVPLWLRLTLAWVRAHGERFYHFEGLDAFKAKFRPDRWEPVYAIVNRATFPPRALYAIAGAFAGGSPIVAVMRGVMHALRQEVRWLRGSSSSRD
jgi:phosphatidylglycerol lysyltransferase